MRHGHSRANEKDLILSSPGQGTSPGGGLSQTGKEQVAKNETILLVSHGDILQILQTAFAGIRSGLHRTLPHLETAQLKRLN